MTPSIESMKEVLEVYQRLCDPKRPVVCLDEQPIQLIAETRRPITPQPGRPQCYDYEYERLETAVNFKLTKPSGGRAK